MTYPSRACTTPAVGFAAVVISTRTGHKLLISRMSNSPPSIQRICSSWVKASRACPLSTSVATRNGPMLSSAQRSLAERAEQLNSRVTSSAKCAKGTASR